MSKSLSEYAEWLDGRGLLWPSAPPQTPVKAEPTLKPLRGIRAVAWNIYGTLLRITGGRLYHVSPEPLRMQIALEKTIEEFAMWNSMTRKPGAPWELMLRWYTEIVEQLGMVGTRHKGETPEINSADVWRKVVARLGQKEYEYDADLGDEDELAEKIAYFFHSSLQGVEAAPGALETLETVHRTCRQGLIADAQPFTLVQLLRALGAQGKLASLGEVLTGGCQTLSYQEGIRKPSRRLFAVAVQRFHSAGVEPYEVLYIGNRLSDDVAVARQVGFRTALYAGDGVSLHATAADLRDPALKPDRMITALIQVRELLGL
jgi:FMN phosphatase YigB (HAD superfamily)